VANQPTTVVAAAAAPISAQSHGANCGVACIAAQAETPPNPEEAQLNGGGPTRKAAQRPTPIPITTAEIITNRGMWSARRIGPNATAIEPGQQIISSTPRVEPAAVTRH
jgi:hypothetical protein